MKIYKHEPKELVRVCISKRGSESIYLTFSDTNIEECYSNIAQLLSEIKVSALQEKYVTRIDLRKAVGGSNGKSISLSLKGLTPNEIESLLIQKYG